MSIYGKVWRKISSFRGYGHAERACPKIGDIWRITPELRLLAPADADNSDSPMILVGAAEISYYDEAERPRARVCQVGAYWSDSTGGRSGWHIQFEFIEPVHEFRNGQVAVLSPERVG